MQKIMLALIWFMVCFLTGKLLRVDDNLKEYNKHVCATYGYYEDCKTPLPEELRLK